MNALSSRLLSLLAPLLAAGVSPIAGCSSNGNGDAPAGPIVFAPEAAGGGVVVFLSARPPLGDRIAFDVVARGAAEIHGAAFRLTWDSESLNFVGAESSDVWSKHALSLSKEGSPGQLAVAWTEKGETGIVGATGDTILGSVSFDARGRKGSSLAFKVERSKLVDRKGQQVSASWRGGSIAPR